MKYSAKMQRESLHATLAEQQKALLVQQAEERYRAEVEQAGLEIQKEHHNVVLLTGPSASGKTTTAQMLVQQLTKSGKTVHRISLDDFYKSRDQLPFWEDGSRNYETVEALDLELFDRTLHQLMQEGKAEIPQHDFKTGKRKPETQHITYNDQTVLIFEGIHALNPLLSSHLNDKNIYRIYVSVHSDFINEQGEVLLNARSLRFLRRLLRDETHRRTDVRETLRMWGYVLQGEELYIQPFRQYADVHINSTHAYEPYLYASRGAALLEAVRGCEVQQELVADLLRILPKLPTIPEDAIPNNSLIQEFIS